MADSIDRASELTQQRLDAALASRLQPTAWVATNDCEECGEPAPTDDHDPGDATEYVRVDATGCQEVQAELGSPERCARQLLQALADAEQRYRWAHDTHGADSLAAGQAWDRMRRAGHQAHQHLNQLTDQEA
jgi:hypothetical protein